MGKACIAIGIGKTHGLAELPGAVRSASQFARWAAGAGFDVGLVIDAAADPALLTPTIDATDAGRPVTIQRVCAAMMKRLPAANDHVDRGGPADPPERLIVYFAGHGMLTMSSDDLWLLSDSYNDQLAIGITQLQDMLKTYLPGQIAIVSDCCRTPAVANWNVRMTAMAVIPRGEYDPNNFDQIDIDRFLAVPPLTSAYMVRATAEAPARCIFTSVLLEALYGTGYKCYDTDRPDAITSQSIARYLRSNVAERAMRFQVEMRPQTYPCWLDPDTYVTRTELAAMDLPPLDPWPGAGGTAAQGTPAVAPAPGVDAILDGLGVAEGIVRGETPVRANRITIGGTVEYETPPPPLTDDEVEQLQGEQAMLARAHADLAATQARIEGIMARGGRVTHLESECGLTVAGVDLRAPVTGSQAEIRDDRQFAGSFRIDLLGGPQGRGAWVLGETGTGDILATMALGGFITDCIVEEQGCVSASFRAMWLDPSVRLPSEAAMARGMRRGEDAGWDRPVEYIAEDALEWVAGMGAAKTFDPMLGVLAAYLFHDAGQTDRVRRIASLFAAQGLALPFDIALLSGAPVVQRPDGMLSIDVPAVKARPPRGRTETIHAAALGATAPVTLAVAGAFPILLQGWSRFATAAPGLAASGLADLIPHLTPSMFTTFDATAAAPLAAILEISSWPS